jgi:branched-chain amino acid transport system ATP-binding protein
MTAVIEVEGLCAGHKGVPAVRDLDLVVESGEVVALLGPNGAGKTTTLLTIAGVLPVLQGEVKVLGESIKGKHIHEIVRRGLGLVPEDRGLFFHLTVAENLRLGHRKGSNITIEHALGYFPALASLLQRRCGLLSGGEQQMLGVARALIAGPKVLMIDEMSLGLAPIIVERLLPVIRQIADDQQMGVLLVEQHVHMALGLADRAYVLSHGELSIAGSVEHLQAHPEIIEASYLGRLTTAGAEAPDIIELLRGVPLFSRCNAKDLDLVAQIMTALTFASGETLLSEGGRADSFIVIVNGTADVTRAGQRLASIGPGDFVGEVGLVLNRHRNASVTATSDMFVLVSDPGQFHHLLDEVPGLAQAVLEALESRTA